MSHDQKVVAETEQNKNNFVPRENIAAPLRKPLRR
jgi:hypothetical protein